MLYFFFLPLKITCKIIIYLNCLCCYWSGFLLLESNASSWISGSINSFVFCVFDLFFLEFLLFCFVFILCIEISL